MAFKDNAVTRTITGTIQRPDGKPAKGKISLTLQDSLSGREEGVVYSKQTSTEQLDETGSFSIDFAVTARGLTTAEQQSRLVAKAELTTKEAQLKTVMDAIDAHLKKASTQHVTPEEIAVFEQNKQSKATIQMEIVQLGETIRDLDKYESDLLDSGTVVLVQIQLTDPKATDRYETTIPIGGGSLDLTEMERDAGVRSNIYASQAQLNSLRNYLDQGFIRRSAVPVSANSPGVTGQVAYSQTHLYVCIATNLWKRVSLGGW